MIFGGYKLYMSDSTRALILEQLYQVHDPEFEVNIVDLGLLRGLEIDGNEVSLTLTLTSPACPFDDVIEDLVSARLERLGFSANFFWSHLPPWSFDDVTPDGRAQLRAVGL